eukprot:6192197-Pleurochrysis_carterae.AAC.2
MTVSEKCRIVIDKDAEDQGAIHIYAEFLVVSHTEAAYSSPSHWANTVTTVPIRPEEFPSTHCAQFLKLQNAAVSHSIMPYQTVLIFAPTSI